MAKRKRGPNFWCADLETTTPYSEYFKEHNEPCISVCAGIRVLNGKAEARVLTVDLIKFLDEIIAIDPALEIKIYYHNLGNFDGSYILEGLATNGFKITYEKEPVGSKWVSTFMADNGNIYRVKVYYKKRLFIFEDSVKLLSLTIKSLGEIQGLPKLESNYKFEKYDDINQIPDREVKYVFRDCEIMVQPLVDFYHVFKKVKLTAGSTSLNELYEDIARKFDNKNKANRFFGYLTNTDLTTASNMLRFCYGGLNFVNHNKLKQLIKGCYIYDATSFYPSQMALKPMIVSKTFKEVPVDYVCKADEVALVDICIKSVKNKGGKTDFYFFRNFNKQTERMGGVASLNNTDTYLKESSEIMFGSMFESELLEDLEWVDLDYYVERKYVYKTDYYMRDYIMAMFDKRKALKQAKDLREHCYKIILNTIFGKLMENPLKLQLRYYPENVELKEGSEYDGVRIVRLKDESFNIKGYKAYVVQELTLPEIVRNPIIGGYITALARTELKKLVRKYRDNTVYGDTDSVMLTRTIPEFENSSGELGTWKRELPEYKDGLNMFIYGTKRYIIDNEKEVVKLAMCGASKDKFLELANNLVKDNNKAAKLKGLINQELADMKLAKRMAKGKRYLIDSTYQIRDKDEEKQ